LVHSWSASGILEPRQAALELVDPLAQLFELALVAFLSILHCGDIDPDVAVTSEIYTETDKLSTARMARG
jgi:hypothetical protein